MNKFNNLLKTITLIIFLVLILFFWQEKLFKTQTKAQIPGWSYRKKITINETKISGSGSLVNFPILVNITDSDLAGKAQVNGNDILFTASDGTTKLNHEIEKFTKSTGQLIAWVNIPSLSATADTDIYMYYENASAANQQNPAGTWNSNYNAVWHLSETGGIRYDSTGNNNLTDVNTVGSATGNVDGAANFVSSNSEELTITDASQIGLEPTGQMTFQAWVKAGTTAQTQGIITKSDLNTFGYRMRPNSSGWIDCTVFNGSNSAGAKTNLNPFTNSWNLIHCV